MWSCRARASLDLKRRASWSASRRGGQSHDLYMSEPSGSALRKSTWGQTEATLDCPDSDRTPEVRQEKLVRVNDLLGCQ